MAKGAEDRSFYRYLRLASLCEVGGDPGRFTVAPDEFHAENLERRRSRPRTMLASSTHDTKRSEDVRARSAALTWAVAADPEAVGGFLRGWIAELVGRTGVDAATVSLATQTVVTTPGLDAERLGEYLVKACREAATRTDWEQPDDAYERRLAELAELAASTDAEPQLHLDRLAPGISLVATALRLTSPGVPDVYQGAEAFTFRLVDPDNRVPPDWSELERWSADERTVAELWSENERAVKTVLVRELLALRRRRPVSFGVDGAYTPIAVSPGAIGFGRGDDVVVAVRRGASEVSGPLTFPTGTWYDVLDPMAPTMSGTVDAASIVGSGAEQTLPVAVFERE
jgi:(1->4)-alpha-D-glucan 1-alpha-D-glucosylmutase